VSIAPDPRRCPLCGRANACALAGRPAADPAAPADAAERPDCWCAALRIDPAILARVPEAARGRACLCRRCAEGERAGRTDEG